jgi:hypothetical protein
MTQGLLLALQLSPLAIVQLPKVVWMRIFLQAMMIFSLVLEMFATKPQLVV